jgi:hypothetical protein
MITVVGVGVGVTVDVMLGVTVLVGVQQQLSEVAN